MRMGWCFVGLALAAASGSAAPSPASGTYAASIYVGGSTAGCADPDGAKYAGVLNYGGIDYNRAGLRVPLTNPSAVSIQTLTANAGLGTLTPSGTFAWKISDGHNSRNFTGTWSATLTVVDSVSFLASIKEIYAGGACLEFLDVSLTRVGPHQN